MKYLTEKKTTKPSFKLIFRIIQLMLASK